MDQWIARLFESPEMLDMGHCQRQEDLNLGMGFLYYSLARLIRPQRVMVIGSYRGFAPLIFARAMSENSEQGSVWFIDPSLVDEFWKDAAAVEKHFAGYGVHNIRHFMMTAQQFVETEEYRSLDEIGILMCDSLHVAEQAKFEFEAFERFVPAHGMILFHDSLSKHNSRIYEPKKYQYSVYQFIDQLKSRSDLQVLDLPFHYGLTLVRKIGEQDAPCDDPIEYS